VCCWLVYLCVCCCVLCFVPNHLAFCILPHDIRVDLAVNLSSGCNCQLFENTAFGWWCCSCCVVQSGSMTSLKSWRQWNLRLSSSYWQPACCSDYFITVVLIDFLTNSHSATHCQHLTSHQTATMCRDGRWLAWSLKLPTMCPVTPVGCKTTLSHTHW